MRELALRSAEPSPIPDAMLRDLFAGVVLSSFDCRGLKGEDVAARCYEVADALMEERGERAEVERAELMVAAEIADRA
jgi:hypothetical protein